MNLPKLSPWRIVGAAGTLACLAVYVHAPSFPTPDKLLILLTFVFMAFNQALQMLKRLLPFVVLILVYESFRSVADRLNTHVDYIFAPHMDKLLFGRLPTVWLQQHLWHGHTQWYDIMLYVPYLLFFVIPLGMALLVWKTRDRQYWRVITAYSTAFFAGFATFLLFPAAPPWLASQNHYIQPISRISSNVWFSLGIHDFPSIYDRFAPNPVAAIPSLHAAIATLTSLLVFKLYGRRWGAVSLVYPAMICLGVVYEGEHYATDVIIGIIYAVAAYLATPHLMKIIKMASRKLPLPYAGARI